MKLYYYEAIEQPVGDLDHRRYLTPSNRSELGSGTNKQDMIDTESQSVFKKRSFYDHHHPSLNSLSERRSGAQ